MRWPSPRAHTAQPERWRMRRWSKEPRRMSVVEGREVARVARVLSVRFIYIHETTKRWSCQEFFKHFYEILFCSIRRPIGHAPTPSSGNDDARLSVASHVSSDSISHCFRTKDGLAALQKNRSRLQSVTPEYALRLDASISYEFRDRNYLIAPTELPQLASPPPSQPRRA